LNCTVKKRTTKDNARQSKTIDRKKERKKERKAIEETREQRRCGTKVK